MSSYGTWLGLVAGVLLAVRVAAGADFDGDLDVDQEDFARLQACFSGTSFPIMPGCENADLNGDSSVDLADFSVFQACVSGPDIPAAAGCILPLPEDTLLVPPPRVGPLLATDTGYEVGSGCPYDDPGKCQTPIYRPYDRDTPQWWDYLVEELIHSRVHVVLMLGRGCFDLQTGDNGNGNMCPRLLRYLVDAIDRCDGARDVLRIAMFDDTGAYQGARNITEGLPPNTLFDLANSNNWKYFWDYNMKIWFDTVPPDLWYRFNGQPVVVFWGPVWMSNIQGHASQLFNYLRTNFMSRYGENPHFNVTIDWTKSDTTLTTTHVQAVEGWFDPTKTNFTYMSWNNAMWGCTVPGFRDPNNFPGCGLPCREQLRNDGAALRTALMTGITKGAKFTLLEGWTDIAESAGYYRSDAWRYPNQYVNIVREFADPETRTLRFQAEAADAWFDLTSGNTGGAYRDGDLDIGLLPGGSGWYVGWTQPGEWLQWSEVTLACGTYRFTARVSGSVGQRLHLEVDGASLGSVQLVRAGAPGAWQLLRVGGCSLAAGRHTLKLAFETGQISADWLFSRKLTTAGQNCVCMHLRASNGQYVIASNGGGGTVRADSATAAEWQSFTALDLNGGVLQSGDKIALLTWDGQNYIRADNGGGGAVSALSTAIGTREQFTLIRIAGSGAINNGDNVALQASNGQYVVAENGGGGVVNANRIAIGPWETFHFETCQ